VGERKVVNKWRQQMVMAESERRVECERIRVLEKALTRFIAIRCHLSKK